MEYLLLTCSLGDPSTPQECADGLPAARWLGGRLGSEPAKMNPVVLGSQVFRLVQVDVDM